MTEITIRRSPNRSFRIYRPESLLDEIERFASDVWEGRRAHGYHGEMRPRVDMYEHKDELVVSLEMPGMSKDDIDISSDSEYLYVKGEKKKPEMPENASFYTCERSFGSYSRRISLPFPVDSDKISATFENGLLEIRLPKAEEARAKHIEVTAK